MFTKLDDKDTAPSRSVGELSLLLTGCALTETISRGHGCACAPPAFALLYLRAARAGIGLTPDAVQSAAQISSPSLCPAYFPPTGMQSYTNLPSEPCHAAVKPCFLLHAGLSSVSTDVHLCPCTPACFSAAVHCCLRECGCDGNTFSHGNSIALHPMPTS